MEAPAPTLYERLGGAPAIEAVVDELYRRILDDPVLASLFNRTNMRAHKGSVRTFVTAVTGGPVQYRGPDMATAHAGRAIDDRHFDLVAGYLVGVLEWAGADPVAADELVSSVAGLRADVVTVKPATV